MHIRGGVGALSISLSCNLLAFWPSILLEASTSGFLHLPTISYCISLHVRVIDGALEIFYWSVMTFDWSNANTNPPKASYRLGYMYDQMANSIDLEWLKTESFGFFHGEISIAFSTADLEDRSGLALIKLSTDAWKKISLKKD